MKIILCTTDYSSMFLNRYLQLTKNAPKAKSNNCGTHVCSQLQQEMEIGDMASTNDLSHTWCLEFVESVECMGLLEYLADIQEYL